MPLTDDQRREVGRLMAALRGFDNDNSGDGRETKARVTDQLAALHAKLSTPGKRTGGFDPREADRERSGFGSDARTIDDVVRRSAHDDETRELHQLNDELLITAACCNTTPDRLRLYRDAERLP